MANTIINFKRGNSGSLTVNSVNSNEPIWTNDDEYKRLFISEGNNSATIVNPVVRYNSRFPNELGSDFPTQYGHGDDEFIEFPNIFSKEARNANFGLVGILFDNLSFDGLTNRVHGYVRLYFHVDGTDDDIRFEYAQVRVDSESAPTLTAYFWEDEYDLTHAFYGNTLMHEIYFRFIDGLSDIDASFEKECHIDIFYSRNSSPKEVRFTITYDVNEGFKYDVKEGDYRNIIMENTSNYEIGKDCMEVGYNYSFTNRLRELTDLHYYSYTGLRPGKFFGINYAYPKYENNLSIGGIGGNGSEIRPLNTVGTITLHSIGESERDVFITNIIPSDNPSTNEYESREVNVILPRTSGTIPTVNRLNTTYENGYNGIVGGYYKKSTYGVIHFINVNGSTDVVVGRNDQQNVDFVTVPIDISPSHYDNPSQLTHMSGYSDIFLTTHVEYSTENASTPLDTARTKFQWKRIEDFFDVGDGSDPNHSLSFIGTEDPDTGLTTYTIGVNASLFPQNPITSIEIGVGLDNTSQTTPRRITPQHSDIRLKTASNGEIGGLKVYGSPVPPSQYSISSTGVNYPVRIDQNSLGFVTVPLVKDDCYTTVEKAITSHDFIGRYGNPYMDHQLSASSAKWKEGITHYIYDYVNDDDRNVSLGVGDFFAVNEGQVLTIYIGNLSDFFLEGETINKLHHFFFCSETRDVELINSVYYANADIPIHVHFNDIVINSATELEAIGDIRRGECDMAVAELYKANHGNETIVKCFWRFYSQSTLEEEDYWSQF